MSKWLIRGGRILDPASEHDAVGDVRLSDGKIVEISPAKGKYKPFEVQEGEQVLEAKGKWVVPGLIDMHVHLREPGEEYKEDIASGAKSAAAGGFATIVAMPNTHPAIDSGELVAFVLKRGKDAGLTRVLSTGALTKSLEGKSLAPYGDMRRAGAVALTDDGLPVSDAHMMRCALEYSQEFNLPVLTHAEDHCLTARGAMHEGEVSTRLGIRGIPRVSEDASVARDVMLAEFTGGHLHVCHVSTRGALEIIRDAQSRGVKVSAETAPHYFALTHEAVEGFHTFAKMAPPLREEDDRQAVIEALIDGTVQAIATDHAPHSSIEKDVAFCEAANGVIGLQSALPLSLELWRDGHLSILDVLAKLTYQPADLLHLDSGRLAIDAVADVTIIDPEAKYVFSTDMLFSKSYNSPFLGRPMQGRATATFVAGQLVYAFENT